MAEIELDPEEKQKRIDRLMEHTKEEIATQWVTVGTNMKEDYDKLKIEFIEYKIANDISDSLKMLDQKNPMKYLEASLEVLYRVIFCI